MKNNNDDNTIEIWTDGACSGNPGPGGWGAILKWKNNIKEISGSEKQTTNNRMELIAAINALKAVKKKPMNIILTTDSKYVKDGITTWIHNWKIKNWKNVKNIDLWKMLDTQQQIHNIQWEWIKGHSGHVQNERCDSMARTEIKKLLKSELD